MASRDRKTKGKRNRSRAADEDSGARPQGGASKTGPTGQSRLAFVAVLTCIAVAAAVISVSLNRQSRTPTYTAPPPSHAPLMETPEPWEYDEANNRYWYAPHGHWHPGPPPPEDQRY